MPDFGYKSHLLFMIIKHACQWPCRNIQFQFYLYSQRSLFLSRYMYISKWTIFMDIVFFKSKLCFYKTNVAQMCVFGKFVSDPWFWLSGSLCQKERYKSCGSDCNITLPFNKETAITWQWLYVVTEGKFSLVHSLDCLCLHPH